MIRWLLVEALRTLFTLFIVSVLAFAVLDTTGRHDWYGTLAPGRTFGLSAEESLALRTARFIASAPDDATTRTLRDLHALSNPAHAQAARHRLLARGTVIIPTALSNIDRLPDGAQREAFAILSTLSQTLTGGETAPTDPARARIWWEHFRILYEIDLRDAYARRHIQRLLDHDSPNALERLHRLGTLALPALFEALDGSLETSSARRLCNLASDLTGLEHRVTANATAAQTQAIVEGWRAWWFVHRLDYVRMGETQRSIARVTNTRFGLWLGRLLVGRTGPTVATGQSALHELQERLPRSTFIAGLGGLLATAWVVAFGGGKEPRRGTLGAKTAQFAAALIPGLAAFSVGFVALCSVCSHREPTLSFARSVLRDWPSLLMGTVLLAAFTVRFLRRKSAKFVLDAVRSAVERWTTESRTHEPARLLSHEVRVGIASLLAPAALNAPIIVALLLLVEPLARVHGMGALTVGSLGQNDGVWLMLATLSVVPVAIGTRWARAALRWSLRAHRTVFAEQTRTSLAPTQPAQRTMAP